MGSCLGWDRQAQQSGQGCQEAMAGSPQEVASVAINTSAMPVFISFVLLLFLWRSGTLKDSCPCPAPALGCAGFSMSVFCLCPSVRPPVCRSVSVWLFGCLAVSLALADALSCCLRAFGQVMRGGAHWILTPLVRPLKVCFADIEL